MFVYSVTVDNDIWCIYSSFVHSLLASHYFIGMCWLSGFFCVLHGVINIGLIRTTSGLILLFLFLTGSEDFFLAAGASETPVLSWLPNFVEKKDKFWKARSRFSLMHSFFGQK